MKDLPIEVAAAISGLRGNRCREQAHELPISPRVSRSAERSYVVFSHSLLTGLILTSVLLATAAADEPALTREQTDFFETKIRPVLVSECYGCHSAEAAQQGKLRGQLYLDSREATHKGGETGPAVVPGNIADSLLISALKHESLEMPPKGKLPADVIDNFVKWVEMGAPDPRSGTTARPASPQIDLANGRKFWAFQPLHDTPPPQLPEPYTSTHIVDRWIIQQQLSHGLYPSPLAMPRILVRRAWFDLLGIPPTPEQMREWSAKLATQDAAGKPTINRQAWGELIDYLLAQPQYGERWARHWIDIARFAESHGYEQDYDRPTAYHYRDFLIRAFNEDLPYDQFIRWQLAGDEMAPQNPQAWMATGFLGGGAFPTQLTEAEFESARYDELDDMVATTGVAFLGLSVGCARCHDHKFDPIASLDYYRMAATFTTAIRTEKEFDLDPEGNRARAEEFNRQLAAARQSLTDFDTQQLPAKTLELVRQFDASSTANDSWQVLTGELKAAHGTKFKQLDDKSYLAAGKAPPQEVLTFTATIPAGSISALRFEALADDSLPQKGPGRAGNGSFVLGNFAAEWIGETAEAATESILLTEPQATFQQDNGSLSIAASLDQDPMKTGWAVFGQTGFDHAATFKLANPLQLAAPKQIRVTLRFEHPNQQHATGRLRISFTGAKQPRLVVGEGTRSPETVAALGRLHDQVQAGLDAAAIAEKHAADWNLALQVTTQESLERLQLSRKVQQLERQGPSQVLTKVLVTSEGLPHLPHHADDRGFPHFYPETFVLRRGDAQQKVEPVQAGLLRVLSPEGVEVSRWSAASRDNSLASYRRSALAGWITDTEQGAGPLAARVMANRLWQHHFGRGIVATPNDFGAAGERPSHPELLDALAAELIRGQWRLKSLHRLIMTSDTYMQGAKVADDPRAKIDLDNRHFWHRSPLRLEAEAIRDSMLFVAGMLDPKMYGPGTLDSNMKRRSIYFFIKRSQLIPEMMLFDWPEHLVSIGQRSATTIAPQALQFINSPQGRSYAAALAARAIRETANQPFSETITRAYQHSLGRDPSTPELQLADAFIKAQTQVRTEQGEKDAQDQALTDLCQTIMSMNEFVYID